MKHIFGNYVPDAAGPPPSHLHTDITVVPPALGTAETSGWGDFHIAEKLLGIRQVPRAQDRCPMTSKESARTRPCRHDLAIDQDAAGIATALAVFEFPGYLTALPRQLRPATVLGWVLLDPVALLRHQLP